MSPEEYPVGFRSLAARAFPLRSASDGVEKTLRVVLSEAVPEWPAQEETEPRHSHWRGFVFLDNIKI